MTDKSLECWAFGSKDGDKLELMVTIHAATEAGARKVATMLIVSFLHAGAPPTLFAIARITGPCQHDAKLEDGCTEIEPVLMHRPGGAVN